MCIRDSTRPVPAADKHTNITKSTIPVTLSALNLSFFLEDFFLEDLVLGEDVYKRQTLDELADIKTAVSEAVTNSIIHGYDAVSYTHLL